MTPRQTEKLMIKRAAKFTGTKGERQFEAYQKSRNLGLVHDVSVVFSDIGGKQFTFQLDFVKPTTTINPEYCTACINIDYEIDGKGHKEKWDDWKDALKSKAGVRVIHIPEAITAAKYWPYLDKKIAECLLSKELIHHIAA